LHHCTPVAIITTHSAPRLWQSNNSLAPQHYFSRW
jgi:hypothetical protein